MFNFNGAFDYGGIPGSIEQPDETLDVIIDGKLYENIEGKVMIDGNLEEESILQQKHFQNIFHLRIFS